MIKNIDYIKIKKKIVENSLELNNSLSKVKRLSIKLDESLSQDSEKSELKNLFNNF